MGDSSGKVAKNLRGIWEAELFHLGLFWHPGFLSQEKDQEMQTMIKFQVNV